MKSVVALLAALLISLTCASCGSTHKKLDLPRDQIAQVRGVSSGFKLLGSSTSITFTEIDGKPTRDGVFSSAPHVVDVTPGKHTFKVYYNVNYDTHSGPDGDAVVEIDAQAGKVYQLELSLDADRTRVLVSEVEGQ
ncbi:MAG: hypothetical protein ACKVWV_17330 [Planctomycetota bacterium]